MNLQPVLQKLYPAGSYGGQCFTFLHKLADFPSVGDLLYQKKRALASFGIPIAKLDTFKIGDILLTNESKVNGHGAMITYIPEGKLQVVESNFHYLTRPGRIEYGRLLDPHDPAILGVFRKPLKFSLPAVTYPVKLNVVVLMNNQPRWESMIKHLSNLQQWFWQASGQRLQVVAYFTHTNLTGWETAFVGDSPRLEVIKEEWFDQHILPIVGNVMPGGQKAHAVLFNMKRDDWHGSVFDHPEQIELGYCYEHNINNQPDKLLPLKAMLVSDEHDDYPPYYPAPLSAFAKLAAHELIHGLYGACANDKVVPGGDYTHNWFLAQNGYPLNPAGVFDQFDYQKLQDLINSY